MRDGHQRGGISCSWVERTPKMSKCLDTLIDISSFVTASACENSSATYNACACYLDPKTFHQERSSLDTSTALSCPRGGQRYLLFSSVFAWRWHSTETLQLSGIRPYAIQYPPHSPCSEDKMVELVQKMSLARMGLAVQIRKLPLLSVKTSAANNMRP